jgi:hypothetical protein
MKKKLIRIKSYQINTTMTTPSTHSSCSKYKYLTRSKKIPIQISEYQLKRKLIDQQNQTNLAYIHEKLEHDSNHSPSENEVSKNSPIPQGKFPIDQNSDESVDELGFTELPIEYLFSNKNNKMYSFSGTNRARPWTKKSKTSRNNT